MKQKTKTMQYGHEPDHEKLCLQFENKVLYNCIQEDNQLRDRLSRRVDTIKNRVRNITPLRKDRHKHNLLQAQLDKLEEDIKNVGRIRPAD